MPVSRGQPWGAPGPLPADGIIVASDAEARAVVEEARRANHPVPVLGLLGGDLCRTIGGAGDAARLRSVDAVTFPVDLGTVLADGRLYWFVSHLVARSRLWRRALVAMNAQWYGSWNLGPRAHPGDGLLDTYDARLPFKDLWKVRSRLHHGAHLPHPGIKERRVGALQIDLERALPLELDGVAAGMVRSLSIRVESDALRVVV
jgi:YegS C-terminal NAD kinase beta sandwich-like domain